MHSLSDMPSADRTTACRVVVVPSAQALRRASGPSVYRCGISHVEVTSTVIWESLARSSAPWMLARSHRQHEITSSCLLGAVGAAVWARRRQHAALPRSAPSLVEASACPGGCARCHPLFRLNGTPDLGLSRPPPPHTEKRPRHDSFGGPPRIGDGFPAHRVARGVRARVCHLPSHRARPLSCSGGIRRHRTRARAP